jgi:inner membrane protein
LPDLDVFIDYGGDVENFTFHRGFSHSLFVLAPFSLLLWLALKRWWAPVRAAPLPWLAAISLALLTHPLMDAHTAYGTQLFWPMTVAPTSWATLFIIDPLYTVPLLAGVVIAAIWPTRRRGLVGLSAGLLLSTLYVGWSWAAQGIVQQRADVALAELQLDDASTFITPTPFNTVLWRVVVRTDDGYLEGFDSLLVDEETIEFRAYTSDVRALEAASDLWPVARLRWFSRDFVKAHVDDGKLVISDLRMGQEPFYVFRHVVAERSNPHWKVVPSELLPFSASERALKTTWQRIWSE